MLLDLLYLLVGAFLLYVGAEWLIKGAAGLARSYGVPPLVVGLTVVAYATSAPELAVSIVASLDGKSSIALGNVLGSNIANLGLILGVTALVAPPRIDGAIARLELPVLVLSALLLPALLWDGQILRWEGVLLVLGSLAFTWLVIRGRPTSMTSVQPPGSDAAAIIERDAEAAGAPEATGRLTLGLLGVIGLVTLVGGGHLLVDAAVRLALAFGISERVVGLTIVAVGTSLPELAASLIAAKRGHSALAVGNVIGSNIFNILLVLGGASAIQPIDGTLALVGRDVAVMCALTLATVWMMRGSRLLSRWEGAALLAGYAAFLVALVGLP